MVLDSSTTASTPSPAPLRRVRQGRWVAGVCQGLARRWDLNVVQVRALFVLASVLAGLGALAYVACWLVLPLDGGDENSSSLVRGMASLALIGAAAVGLATLGVAAALTTLFGFGWAVAVGAAVFLVAALVAWPTVRPAWALAMLAAAIVPAVAVAASGVSIAPKAGLLIATPETAQDVEAEYHMGIGALLVDLRRLKAPADSVVPIRIDSGSGRTVVALPRDRCFNLDVHYRTSRGWALLRPLAHSVEHQATFYGRGMPADGHWRRTSNDPHAPTLKVNYSAVVGSLMIRDYPATTGPLYDRWWPMNVQAPASPGARRWAWREEVRTRSVQRRWRIWRKQLARFEHHREVLDRGVCAPKPAPSR